MPKRNRLHILICAGEYTQHNCSPLRKLCHVQAQWDDKHGASEGQAALCCGAGPPCHLTPVAIASFSNPRAPPPPLDSSSPPLLSYYYTSAAATLPPRAPSGMAFQYTDHALGMDAAANPGFGAGAGGAGWEREKTAIAAHPLYERLLEAHVACLRVATPVDQLPRIDAQIAARPPLMAAPGGAQSGDEELDLFMVSARPQVPLLSLAVIIIL
jgi:hypothetical protein